VPLSMFGSLNGAADYVVQSTGLDLTYTNWDISGALLPMSIFDKFKPFELVKPGEDKWTTLKRLFRYYNMEPFPQNDGVLSSRTLDLVPDVVGLELRPSRKLTTDYRQAMMAIANTFDASNNATSVFAYGELDDGRLYNVYAEDPSANNAAHENFCLWEEPMIEEVSGASVTEGLVIQRAQSLAFEHFPSTRQPWTPDFEVAVYPELDTNIRVRVFGSDGVGIPDEQDHILVGLEHTYENMRGITGMTTKGALRRITNVGP
jgi:hypothetical protein